MSFSVPQNNPITATVTFLDVNGNAFDPVSAIKILVRDPNGGVATYAFSPGPVVRTSVGVYYINFEVSKEGLYYARGQGQLLDGSTVTSPDATISVLPSVV